jgi:hypothetical protein
MQLYGGLEARNYKGKPKYVAYNITMKELRAPISLLEVHLKLLTRIVNRRLVHYLLDEGYFSETQFCPDAFHILLGAIEDAAERQREIHMCVVDLTKAFDSLSPQSLAQAYREAGLSEKSF